MKQKVRFMVLLLSCCSGIAQNREQTYNKIKENIYGQLDSYICDVKDGKVKAISDTVFADQYRKVFATVILNSQDLVNNGSAFSYSRDEDKGTLSLNASLFASKKANIILDLGANITNKDNNYTFYSDNSLKNEIGVRVGVVIPFWHKTMIFMPSECKKLMIKREDAMRKKILEYKRVLQLDQLRVDSDSVQLASQIAKQQQFYYIDTVNYIKKWAALKKDRAQLHALTKATDAQLAALVSKDFADFDSKEDLFNGSRSYWINISGNFKNNSLKVQNDSLVAEERRIDHAFKFTAEVSFNNNRHYSKHLWYWQVFARLNRGSYLDDIRFKDQKFYVNYTEGLPVPEPLTVTIEEETSYGEKTKNTLAYNDLKHPFLSMETGGYASWFHFYKKTLGLFVRASASFPAAGNLITAFTNNYTVLMGPILKTDGEDNWLKATVGIQCGVEQSPYKVNVWDQFIVKAFIGIPFNVFSKKKAKTEAAN